MIPEINSALPVGIDQDETGSPIRPRFNQNQNLLVPTNLENFLSIPEELDSGNRSDASLDSYSNRDSKASRNVNIQK